MSNQWLKLLKQGDDVIVRYYSWSYDRFEIEKVEKITPSGFIKVAGALYRSDDGRSRGNSGSCLLDINDNDNKERFKKYKQDAYAKCVLRKLRDTKCITYEQAIKINEIMGW